MKKAMLGALLWLGVSGVSFAQEPTQNAQEASAELIQSLIETCKGYAKEDEVSEQDLEKYLLACVNDELAMDDYQLLKQLPPSATKH